MEKDGGARENVDRLFLVVYDELHELAEQQLKAERPGHTLQPTALVNEVYLRLVNQRKTSWESPAEFRRVAAMAMSRVLVDMREDGTA